jgi:hypothetical protein
MMTRQSMKLDEFVNRIRPDLVGSGIKEKYVLRKNGLSLPPDAFLGLLPDRIMPMTGSRSLARDFGYCD